MLVRVSWANDCRLHDWHTLVLGIPCGCFKAGVPTVYNNRRGSEDWTANLTTDTPNQAPAAGKVSKHEEAFLAADFLHQRIFGMEMTVHFYMLTKLKCTQWTSHTLRSGSADRQLAGRKWTVGRLSNISYHTLTENSHFLLFETFWILWNESIEPNHSGVIAPKTPCCTDAGEPCYDSWTTEVLGGTHCQFNMTCFIL